MLDFDTTYITLALAAAWVFAGRGRVFLTVWFATLAIGWSL